MTVSGLAAAIHTFVAASPACCTDPVGRDVLHRGAAIGAASPIQRHNPIIVAALAFQPQSGDPVGITHHLAVEAARDVVTPGAPLVISIGGSPSRAYGIANPGLGLDTCAERAALEAAAVELREGTPANALIAVRTRAAFRAERVTQEAGAINFVLVDAVAARDAGPHAVLVRAADVAAITALIRTSSGAAQALGVATQAGILGVAVGARKLRNVVASLNTSAIRVVISAVLKPTVAVAGAPALRAEPIALLALAIFVSIVPGGASPQAPAVQRHPLALVALVVPGAVAPITLVVAEATTVGPFDHRVECAAFRARRQASRDAVREVLHVAAAEAVVAKRDAERIAPAIAALCITGDAGRLKPVLVGSCRPKQPWCAPAIRPEDDIERRRRKVSGEGSQNKPAEYEKAGDLQNVYRRQGSLTVRSRTLCSCLGTGIQSWCHRSLDPQGCPAASNRTACSHQGRSHPAIGVRKRRCHRCPRPRWPCKHLQTRSQQCFRHPHECD